MRIAIILIYFFFLQIPVQAQSNWKSFRQLSCPEKWWVVFHPFVAGKAHRLTLEARSTSEEMQRDTMLDGDPNGGQVDAFRHGYWMALLSQNICFRKAQALGKAHEKGDYQKFKKHKIDDEFGIPDSVSGAMDLFNNRIGAEFGRENKSMGKDSLKISIKNAILAGKLKKISKNKKGESLDCEGKIIDVNMYQNRWSIPKCLISSSFPRSE